METEAMETEAMDVTVESMCSINYNVHYSSPSSLDPAISVSVDAGGATPTVGALGTVIMIILFTQEDVIC